jgi:hypothetical protein
MLGSDLFAVRLKLARNLGPGVVGFDQRTAGVAKRVTARGITQQPDHRVRKVVCGVGGEEMTSRFERKALRPNGR